MSRRLTQLLVLGMSLVTAGKRRVQYVGSGEPVNKTTLAVWAIPTICLILAIIVMIFCERHFRSLRQRTMTDVLEEIRMSAKYTPDKLDQVEAPYPIGQEEEMRIYKQNRKWFKDAHAQGVNLWYNETFGGDDVCEIKIMKPLRMFMATYCHTLGTDVRCTGCNAKLVNKEQWYRCRYCTDVNLCSQCFEKGFREPSSGHSSGHETTRFKLDSRCEDCKGFIADTKLLCESCTDVAFCLGCYKSGKHETRHREHSFKTIAATSFMMLPPQNREENGQNVRGAEGPPVCSVTPGVNMTSSNDNMTSQRAAAHPSEPPPSYQECILNHI